MELYTRDFVFLGVPICVLFDYSEPSESTEIIGVKAGDSDIDITGLLSDAILDRIRDALIEFLKVEKKDHDDFLRDLESDDEF